MDKFLAARVESMARNRLDEMVAEAIHDAGLTITVYLWLPHWENRLLPMPLKYA